MPTYTARDMITRALRLIDVVGDGVDLSAEQADDGLKGLNDMLFYWGLEGIQIGHTEATLDTVFTLPDNHMLPVRYNLAVMLAPEFDAVVSDYVAEMANRSFRQLKQEHFVAPKAEFDRELLDFKANRGAGFDFNSG